MTLRNSFIAIIVLIIIISCSHNRLEVDASNIKVNIAYTDMDDMIFNSDSIILMEKHYKFKSEIKDIYDYQVGYCLRIGDVDDTSFYNSIDKYRSDSGIQQLELDIRSHFLDLSNREEIIENGFESTAFPQALLSMYELLAQMDHILTEAPWLAGDEYSLADIAMTPLMERLMELNMEGLLGPDRPNLVKWWKRIQDRNSYRICSVENPNPERQQHLNAGAEAWPLIRSIIK